MKAVKAGTPPVEPEGRRGSGPGPAAGAAAQTRMRLQALAFVLIVLASAGLYFTGSREAAAGTRVLLGVEAAGMVLALWGA